MATSDRRQFEPNPIVCLRLNINNSHHQTHQRVIRVFRLDRKIFVSNQPTKIQCAPCSLPFFFRTYRVSCRVRPCSFLVVRPFNDLRFATESLTWSFRFTEMSQIPDCLKPTQDDIAKLLACDSHTGSTNADKNMTRYVYKRRGDGTCNRFGRKKENRTSSLLSQVSTSSTSPRLGRSWFWLLVSLPPSTTLLMCASSPLELMVNVPSSSTLL